MEWFSSFVDMLRITASLCIRLAVKERSSLTWTPGTDVGIERNGPPNSVPGFGSQLSNWLMPPSSQMKSTWRSFERIAAANPGRSRPRIPIAPAAPPASVPSRRRRDISCSVALHCASVVDISGSTGTRLP